MIDSGKVILIVFEFVSPTLGGESVELVKIEVQNKRQIHQTKNLGYCIILLATEQLHVYREYVLTTFALVLWMAMSHSSEFIHSVDLSAFSGTNRFRIIVGERN